MCQVPICCPLYQQQVTDLPGWWTHNDSNDDNDNDDDNSSGIKNSNINSKHNI